MRQRFAIVVHLLVEAEGQLLLLRRAGTGRADGAWAPPGGHVEAGEWPLAAALRECREETGVVVPAVAARHLASLVYADAPGLGADPLAAGAEARLPLMGLNLLFGARLARCVAPAFDPASASAARWCAPDALPVPTVPWLGDALARRATVEALAPVASPWYAEPPYGRRDA